MLGAIISVGLAVFIVSKLGKQARYWVFPVLVLILLPLTAYVIFGTSRYLEGMTASMVVKDVLSIAGQTFREVFSMVGAGDIQEPNYALRGTGVVIILSIGMALAQTKFPAKRKKEH